MVRPRHCATCRSPSINVGQVAQAQGDWAQAESAYRESLDLSRQLVERLGGTPEALDDLGVALVNVASIPPGDAATKAEATDIYRTLVERYPAVAHYQNRLRALSSDNEIPADGHGSANP